MQIDFRKATFDDSEMLFNWRNDEVTRFASHNTEPLDYDRHCEWLRSTLDNNNRLLLIAEVANVPVGTVRIDYSNEFAELSWAIDPKCRGKGFGKEMLKVLMSTQRRSYQAEIKISNYASIKMAEFAGMKLTKTIDDIHHYQFDINC